MRRPILALLGLLLITGCPNPDAAKPVGTETSSSNNKPTGPRKTATPKPDRTKGPTPTPKPTGGTDPDATASPDGPTPTPFDGETFDPNTKGAARVGINFGEAPGAWAIAPSLNRARVGAVAGSLADRLIVAEGDHHPSFEFLLSAGDRWIVDDAYDGEAGGGAADNGQLFQGLSFAVGGVFNNRTELWTAGGLAGALDPGGTRGIANYYLYREEGFSTSRRPTEGTYALDKGCFAAAGAVVGNHFITAGGATSTNQVIGDTQVLDLGELVNNKFKGAAMPVPVAGGAAAATADKLYVFGGYKIEGGKPVAVNTVQVYDKKTDTWAKDGQGGAPPALTSARHSASAVQLDGVLYLAGGYGADGKPLSTFQTYDLTAGGAWVDNPPLPTARALMAFTAHDRKIWAIGGVGEIKDKDGAMRQAPLQTVEIYQP